jgi:hypothetical protein
MPVQIAIHHRDVGFSGRWIEYCKQHGVQYKIVDCYAQDILAQLTQADGLMWHWSHYTPKDVLLARGLIQVVEGMGKKVFPSTKTCWHFDDKIGQKYLLESVHAPMVFTGIFYDKEQALEWIKQASFPFVFKLSKGSGSQNVRLVHTESEAQQLIRTAFSKGFNPVKDVSDYFQGAGKNIKKTLHNRSVLSVLKRMPRALREKYTRKQLFNREKGYIYFQEYLPHNQYDIRVTIVGNRAFSFTRNVRPNDFRASGSGSIDYDLKRIDLRCVRLAFDITRKIGAQSAGYDFILGAAGEPKITEVSYCYQSLAVYNCPGHWDEQLNWHEGHLWPQDAIIEDFLHELAASSASKA